MSFNSFASSAINFLRKPKNQKVLLDLSPYVVSFCLILGLLAYINIVPESASKFYYNSSMGIFVRALSFFVLLFYSLLCVISLRLKINYRLVIVFGLLVLLNTLMIFVSPHEYDTLYLSKFYGAGSYFITSVSNKSILVSHASAVVDFLWGFCFLWVLPQLFRSKKQLLGIFLLFISIILVTCFYSFLKEKDVYVLVFTDPSKIGSATGLKSMFDTKQTFGVFLCPAFCSCLMSLCLVFNDDKSNRTVKYISIVFFVLSGIIIFFVTIVSLCRTAIVGNAIMLIFYYFAVVFELFKRKRQIIGAILISLFAVILTSFTLFMTVEQLHSSVLLNNVYDFLMQHIFNRITTSADSRLMIMIAYLKEMPALNLFFGFSKGLFDIYVRSLAPILRYGLHSGFVIFIGEYGLILFFITYLFVIKILWKNLRNVRKVPLLAISLLGCFVTVMFMNVSESEILIFSSSSLVFMFNYILIVLADSDYVEKQHQTMKEVSDNE